MASVHTQNIDQASIMYIEHYLDVVESLPNNLARILSRIHEIDIQRSKIANNLDSALKEYSQNLIDSEKHKQLNKFHSMLVQLQNLSDNKIGLAQNMFDQIDLKTRQLDSQGRGASSSMNVSQSHSSASSSTNVNSYANANGNMSTSGRGTSTSSSTNHTSSHPVRPESSSVNERNNSGSITTTSTTSTASAVTAAVVSTATAATASSNSTVSKDNGKESNVTHSNGNGKRTSRRSHGNKKDSNPDSNGGGSGDERASTPAASERTNSTKRANKRAMKGAHKNEGKRRKNSYNYNNNDSPTAVYGGVDPDEPTYCLCEQVSYGEMICCDNPTCKIEWFHFACVSLTAIPKGRWFCPNCRGERSNILRK